MSQIRSLRPFPIISGQACLVLCYAGAPDSAEVGQRFEPAGEEMIVGRGIDADLQVDQDSVSRRHARLSRKDGAWLIADLQSTNGTYVNDMPVTEQPLHAGDLLKIGHAVFKFLEGPGIVPAYFEEIHRLALHDGLTQIHNRRFFLESLGREIARCTRRDRPLSLVFFDVDGFKGINDRYGRLTGDYILKELARRVWGQVRKDDALFARYGGDEFALTLPESGKDAALEFADYVRTVVMGETFDFADDKVPATISLGVASADRPIEAPALCKLADDNLYRAKRTGRNRVVG